MIDTDRQTDRLIDKIRQLYLSIAVTSKFEITNASRD